MSSLDVEMRAEAPFGFFPLGWKPTVLWVSTPGGTLPSLDEFGELARPFVPSDCKRVRVHLYQGVAYLVGYYRDDGQGEDDNDPPGVMMLVRGA